MFILLCMTWSMALTYLGVGVLGLLGLIGLIGGALGLRNILKTKSIGLVPKEAKTKAAPKKETNKGSNNCNQTIVVLMIGMMILLSVIVGGVVYVVMGM